MNHLKITAPLRVDICGGISDILDVSKITGTNITNIALDLYRDENYQIKNDIAVFFEAINKKIIELFYNNIYVDLNSDRNDDLVLIKSIIINHLGKYKLSSGWRISIANKFPIGTGLGGSAAVAISLIFGLNYLLIKKDLTNDPTEIIKQAYYNEVVKLGIKGGFQDFISAFFGGVNKIIFDSNELDRVSMYKQNLGLIPKKDVCEYLNNNIIIALLKKNNINSNIIIEDELNNLRSNKKKFINNINHIIDCNKNIYLLLNSKKELFLRLQKIGNLINESWDCQKKLSNLVGLGILFELELELRPFVYGLRAPGAGGNSLFLLLKPNTKKEILTILNNYNKYIEIYFAQINTKGVEIKN